MASRLYFSIRVMRILLTTLGVTSRVKMSWLQGCVPSDLVLISPYRVASVQPIRSLGEASLSLPQTPLQQQHLTPMYPW